MENIVKNAERKPLPLSEYARKAKNAQQKKYRERHRAEIAEYAKKYRAEHLEELRAYNREYQRTHREQIRQKRIEYWERKGKEQMSMADDVDKAIKDAPTEDEKEIMRNVTIGMFDEMLTDERENPVPEVGIRIGKNGMIIETVAPANE